MARRSIALAVALLTGSAVEAQTPAGPEFQVNDYTSGNQSLASVAVLANGNFVMTWTDNEGADGDLAGVFGRRFAANGAPLGGDFRVNVNTAGYQFPGSMSADGNGGFVVGWADLDTHKVAVRRFDASGQPRGGETSVKEGVTAVPHLASAANGSFVVVWGEYIPGDGNIVLARRFDASGSALGAEFRANVEPAGFDSRPAVASAPDGRFVVAWMANDGYLDGVRARRFAASGAPLGGEFQVNTYTTGYQRWFLGNNDHTVAMATDGSFVVTWSSGPDLSGVDDDVVGQRYDAGGARLGGEFRVNTLPAGDFPEPRIAMAAGGEFVITWTRRFAGTMRIVAQRYDAFGSARGSEFQVNTVTLGSQFFPIVDSDAAGNFVVAWTDYPGQDGSGAGVFAQRFGGLLPSAMTVDSAGNGVLESGETVDVAPAWRNVTGLAQAVTGTLTRFTGPAGGTYTVTDSHADYGTVANGATRSCGTDCYAVSVSGTRPAAHWDAAATEFLFPDSLGERKTWPLHVGESFADVPRGNPFYRFIETLLHRGVTAGCTAGAYCPTASTTREQMAVFVLTAREGAGFLPPACTMATFDDVPLASPFCRWVQELARRGVVGGCGGTSYCPGAPVMRDQMAVIVLRTLDPLLNPPACAAPVFADVPASSPFCRWIEELARRGIVSGCGGGNYCPGTAVTRDQMGVFLGLTFGLSLYGP